MEYKADKAGIEDYIEKLRDLPLLGKARNWWPKYLFHFTDIINAVKILKDNCLYSRSTLESNGGMPHDNASHEIISQTDKEYKTKVRLYFRPRTPTQYRNEGFRSKKDFKLSAHCPVPIYFLFQSKEVLSYKEATFSDGSLARQSDVKVGNDLSFLESMPFEDIYHDGPFEEDEKDSVIRRRHAEVILPEPFPLDSLKYIVCRSKAEMETLIQSVDVFPDNCIVRFHGSLFYGKWTYIENVELMNDRIKVFFNPDSASPGPFKLRIIVHNLHNSNDIISYNKSDFYTSKKPLPLTMSDTRSHYKMEIYLDDHIAFKGEYHDVNY